MKKIFICLAASALIVGLNFRASTSSSTPPPGYSGAPGQTNCTSCHSGTVNSGSGSVTLSGLPSSGYTPGAQYTITINITDASKVRFGFEMVALTTANAQAGTFILVSSNNTSLQLSGGKTYVGHLSANSTKTWTVNWNAPATNVGAVTFYLVGNAANGNSTDTGDNIYSTSVALSPASPTGVKEENTISLNFYPNPATEKLHVDFTEKTTRLKILDLTGREVFSKIPLENSRQLDVSNYPNGTYFLQVEQEKTTQLKRFVVQH
jgi:hypothetical protein